MLCYRKLKDIWTKVGDKKAFVKYVQDSVTAYRKMDGAGSQKLDASTPQPK